MKKSEQTILVLYVPVLHAGYFELFNKYRHRAKTLYLVGPDIIEQFPKTAREIRSIKPKAMATIIAGSQLFESVKIADIAILESLGQDQTSTVITSKDAIGDYLIKTYFKQHPIVQDTIFLRYDESTVKAARQEVDFTGQTSSNEFDRSIIQRLEEEKEKSSDFFLRLGAAVVKNGQLITISHNQRQPTPQAMWSEGDPRNFLEYGSDSHLRTTLHAEQAVIAECARLGVPIEGADFYITVFPCPDCSQVIAKAGIKRLFFREGFSRLSTADLFKVHEIKVIKVVEKS